MTPTQRKIYVGCLVIYGGAYIARLNLASALPSLTAAFSLTEAQGGLIQMLFSLAYAAGQLVNGIIVDRISARRYIIAGLALSALCNILFGLAAAYWQLLLLWALNGVAQSMLWTPTIKLLAGWIDESQRGNVSLWVGVTCICGHFISWAISGYMALYLTWRLSFIVPAAAMLLLAALALCLLRDPPTAEAPVREDGATATERMPLKTMLLHTGLLPILLCCVASGYIRDGVMTWGPSLLDLGDNKASAAMLPMIIPAINLLGVLAGQFLLRRALGRTRAVIGAMMFAGGAVSLLLAILPNVSGIVYALILGVLCALMFGVNPLETTTLPMDYTRFGRVGLAAGIIDSSVYLGSGLVSVSAGYIRATYGSSFMFGTWAVVAVLGAVGALCSIAGARRLTRS